MAIPGYNLSIAATRSILHSGAGFFAGLAPDPLFPESPDGRYRLLNVPARGRVCVYDRRGMICLADTISGTDGTWRIDHLRVDLAYTVIGWDGKGQQNAAIQDWVKPFVPE